LIIGYLPLPAGLTEFENALTNDTLRPLYFELMEGMIDEVPYLSENDEVNKWMIKRGVFPKFLHFFQNIPDSSLKLLESCSDVIQSLSFEDTLFYAELFIYFPYLQYLSIDCGSMVEIGAFLKLHPQLHTLNISGIHESTPDTFQAIVDYCPNLQQLDCSKNDWFNDEHIAVLVRGLQKLVTFDIYLTGVQSHQAIVAIIQNFPLLESFRYFGCHFSLETRTFLFQRALPNIRSADPMIQQDGVLSITAAVAQVTNPLWWKLDMF
jgi:hypothetical protein